MLNMAMLTFEASDEYCPHCDNHFVIEAITPKPTLKVEGEDVRIDSRFVQIIMSRGFLLTVERQNVKR